MQLEYGEQRITVAALDIVIGSGPGATVRLAGVGVRPVHALVRRFGEGLVVINPADDSAEVRVNGTRIGREPTPLLHGDRIEVGPNELLVVDPGRAGETRQVPAARAPSSPPAAPRAATPAAGGARLVSLTDGREYHLKTSPFVLGRDAASAVVLTSPDASRQHAEVVGGPEGDVLVDLSSNGTFVNGSRVPGRHPLKALDVIRIGAEEFRYYPALRSGPATPPGDAPPPGAQFRLGDTLIGLPKLEPMPSLRPEAPSSQPLASFLVRRGQRKGDRIEARTPVVNLGRGDFNDLQLPDASVSASHAKVQLREGVWVVADLGSTNGTAVDGEPVRDEAPLTPGCTLRLGDVELLFEPHDRAAAPVAGTAVLPQALAPEPAAAGPRAGAPRRPLRLGAALVLLLLAALVAWLLWS